MGILQEAYNTDELLADIRKNDIGDDITSTEPKDEKELEDELKKREADSKIPPAQAQTLYSLYIMMTMAFEANLNELNPLNPPEALGMLGGEPVDPIDLATSMQESYKPRNARLNEAIDISIFDPVEAQEFLDKYTDWFTEIFKKEGDAFKFVFMCDFKEKLDELSVDDMRELFEAIDVSPAYNGALLDDEEWKNIKNMYKDGCASYEELIANGGKKPESVEALVAKDDALPAEECENLYAMFTFIKVILFEKGKLGGTRILNLPKNLDESEDGEDFSSDDELESMMESTRLREDVEISDYKANSDKWKKWATDTFSDKLGKMYFVQMKEEFEKLSDDDFVELLYAMDTVNSPKKPIDTPSSLVDETEYEFAKEFRSEAFTAYEKDTFSGEFARDDETLENMQKISGIINAVFGLEDDGIAPYDPDKGSISAFDGIKKLLNGTLQGFQQAADKLAVLSGRKKPENGAPQPELSPEEKARKALIDQWTPWVKKELAGKTDCHMDKVFRTEKSKDFFKAVAEILGDSPEASQSFNEMTTVLYNQAQKVAEGGTDEGTSQLIMNELAKIINGAFGTNIVIMNALVPGEDDDMVEMMLTSVKDAIGQFVSVGKDIMSSVMMLGQKDKASREQVEKQMTSIAQSFIAKVNSKKITESLDSMKEGSTVKELKKQAKQQIKDAKAEAKQFVADAKTYEEFKKRGLTDEQIQAEMKKSGLSDEQIKAEMIEAGLMDDDSDFQKDESEQVELESHKLGNSDENIYNLEDLQNAGGYEDVIELMNKYGRSFLYEDELDYWINEPDDVESVMKINKNLKVTKLLVDGDFEDNAEYTLEELANFCMIEPDYEVALGVFTNPEIYPDGDYREKVKGNEIENVYNDPETALEMLRADKDANLGNMDADKTDYEIEWEERCKKWKGWITGLKGKTSRDLKNKFDGLDEDSQADLLLYLDKVLEPKGMSFEKFNRSHKAVLMMYMPCYMTYTMLKKEDANEKKEYEKLKKGMEESSRNWIISVSDRVQRIMESSII